jgi:hypothetical protein
MCAAVLLVLTGFAIVIADDNMMVLTGGGDSNAGGSWLGTAGDNDLRK